MLQFKKRQISDHEFASYLRSNNWAIEHDDVIGDGRIFRNGSNQTIAVVFYNNRACTKTVYLG